MSNILNIKDKDGNWIGVPTIQGQKGNDGFSPKVKVTQQTDGVNIAITDAEGTTNAKVIGTVTEDYQDLVNEVAAQKEDIAQVNSRVDNIADVIVETVQPLQKQADATDRSLDALWKLSEGQLYNLEQKSEKGTNDAPSGAFSVTMLSADGESLQGENPSPDNPQPITSAEQIVVTKQGKNLFDKANAVTASLFVNTGSNNTLGNVSDRRTVILPCLPNKTYTASKKIASVMRIATLVDYPIQGAVVTNKVASANELNTSITITSGDDDKYLVVQLYVNSDAVQDISVYLEDLQVEIGSVATAYKPYEAPTTTTITPPFPLNAIGDVKDELDVENGVWRKKVNVHETIESQFRQRAVVGNLARYYYPNNVIGIMPLERNVRSNKFHFAQTGVSNGEYGAIYPASGNTVFWIGVDEDLPTDVVVLNPLETEQTFPISESDYQKLLNLGLVDWSTDMGRYIPSGVLSDYTITVTDQDGNDLDWISEYIISLREVQK